MTETRVVPIPLTREMIEIGEHALDESLFAAEVDGRARYVFNAMVAAAPPTEDGAALRASLSTFPTDEALERYRKKLRELADDMVADAEFQVKEDLVPNLAAWVEDLTKRAIDMLLRGNVEQMRRYLHCDGYTGRSTDDAYSFRTREGYEWHPLINGRLSEADPIKVRRLIVEAHRDLITDQRVLDLEDQNRSLLAKVNRKNDEVERLRTELRGLR